MVKLEFIKNLVPTYDLLVDVVCGHYNAESKISEVYEFLEKDLGKHWDDRLKVQGEGDIYNTPYKCEIYVDNAIVGTIEKGSNGRYSVLK